MQQVQEEAPQNALTAYTTSSDMGRGAVAQLQPAPASALELRAYLDTRDTKQIAAAIIKADVRKADALAVQRADLEAQLDRKRKDYAWWLELFESAAMQAAVLQNVKQAAELLKEQMALIPAMPTLREVAKDHGERYAKMQLCNVITWADGQINTGTKLSDEQIITIATAVLEVHGGLRIEDVTTCIKQHVLHASGPVMRLDTQVVMSWFTKYVNERAARLEMENYNKHLARK